jgi:hypothetical protein
MMPLAAARVTNPCKKNRMVAKRIRNGTSREKIRSLVHVRKNARSRLPER